MTADEFSSRAKAALGGRGWQSLLSRAVGVNVSTIRRWASGELPVPDYAAALVELLEQCPAAFRPARWLK